MIEPSSLESDLICAQIALLAQGCRVLQALSADAYRAIPVPGAAPVGGHLRHVVDHYDAFLAGLPLARVDYSARRRDERLERDPAAGLDRLQELGARFRELAANGIERCGTLLVRDEEGEEQLEQNVTAAEEQASWAASSVTRELQFLQSHTVHHYALIAMALRILLPAETLIDDGFGVAPSTLRYRERSLTLTAGEG